MGAEFDGDKNINYEYDKNGNRTKKILPGDHVEYYDYDIEGRLAQITKVDGGIETFGYDGDGNRLYRTIGYDSTASTGSSGGSGTTDGGGSTNGTGKSGSGNDNGNQKDNGNHNGQLKSSSLGFSKIIMPLVDKVVHLLSNAKDSGNSSNSGNSGNGNGNSNGNNGNNGNGGNKDNNGNNGKNSGDDKGNGKDKGNHNGNGNNGNNGKHLGWYKRAQKPKLHGKSTQNSSDNGTYEVENYINDVNLANPQVLMTSDENGNYKSSYTYGLDRISVNTLGITDDKYTPLYYQYDGKGDVTSLVNTADQTEAKYSYDAFGVPKPGVKLDTSANGFINSYGYNGEANDQYSGVQYLRARYYEPETGRFLTRDSYIGNAMNPLTLNRYAYTGNNPIMYSDPSGHRVNSSAYGYDETDADRHYSLSNQTYVERQARGDEPSVLSNGSQGNEVRDLEQKLLNLGYSSVGTADGEFGRATEGALIQFQKDHGITADGIAGRETITALNAEASIKRDSEQYSLAVQNNPPHSPTHNLIEQKPSWDIREIIRNKIQFAYKKTCEGLSYMGTEAQRIGNEAWDIYKQGDLIGAGIVSGTYNFGESLITGIINTPKVVVNEYTQFENDPEKKIAQYGAVAGIVTGNRSLFPEQQDAIINGGTKSFEKSFNDNIVNGNSYTRSKYITEAALNVGSLFVGGELNGLGKAGEVVNVSSKAEDTLNITSKTGDIVNETNDVAKGAAEAGGGLDMDLQLFGRNSNKLKPDPAADGYPHSTFKTDPSTGKITNYETYKSNPQNPTGLDLEIRYDGIGNPHYNPVTGEDLMPHVHDKLVPGGVRIPTIDEIPK